MFVQDNQAQIQTNSFWKSIFYINCAKTQNLIQRQTWCANPIHIDVCASTKFHAKDLESHPALNLKCQSISTFEFQQSFVQKTRNLFQRQTSTLDEIPSLKWNFVETPTMIWIDTQSSMLDVILCLLHTTLLKLKRWYGLTLQVLMFDVILNLAQNFVKT